MDGAPILFWYWFALAVALLIAELFAPGVIFAFLAAGAVAAGLALWIAPDLEIAYQLLLFAAVSAVAFIFGRPLVRRLQRPRRDNGGLNDRGRALVGTVVRLEEPILNGRGRARIGDTTWAIAGPDMAAGFTVRVVAVRGSELTVEPHR